MTPEASSAACPLPDGSLCGTCPDCQADAINDAQWPDGGGPVVIPERAAATKLDEKRPPCRCEPWAQRWRSDHPEVCVNCGGLFAARTVPARRLIRGR